MVAVCVCGELLKEAALLKGLNYRRRQEPGRGCSVGEREKNMEKRIVNAEIALIPYYPNYDAALEWYQDPELCRQVDG